MEENLKDEELAAKVLPFLKAVDEVLNSQTFLLRAPRNTARTFANVEEEIADLIRSDAIFREQYDDDWRPCLSPVAEPPPSAPEMESAPKDQIREFPFAEARDYLAEMIAPGNEPQIFYSPYQKQADKEFAGELANGMLNIVREGATEVQCFRLMWEGFEWWCIEGEGYRPYFCGQGMDTVTVFLSRDTAWMLLTNGGA